MRETIDHSLRFLSADDLHAISAYLKSASANKAATVTPQADALPQQPAGAEVYLSNCAFCHLPGGQGVPGMIPALASDPAVIAEGPENSIHVVVGGLQASHGFAPMPAVGVGMTDGEIAAVVNYVRTAWGNNAPPNAGAGMVAEIRSKSHTLLAGNRANGCPSISDPKLSALVDGVKDQLQGIDMKNMLPRMTRCCQA